jgi:hypothetical protein
MNIDEMIFLYTEEKYSTHKLAEIYKVGHKKISKLLKENNVLIRPKGGQSKGIDSKKIEGLKPITYTSDKNLIAKCKKTGLEINDPNNLSGKLTKHILQLYGDVHIPQNTYQRKKYESTHNKKWFEEYFDIKEIEKKDTLKCELCDWVTFDLENNTGSIKKHIENNHNISVINYVNLFPHHKKLFKKDLKIQSLLKESNHVICNLCGKKMASITNTHLLNKHSMTMNEYKLKFPNAKISSDATTEKLRNNMILNNQNMEPNWTSKGEIEIKEFIESLGLLTDKSKNRKLIIGKEIDIIIPELKIGVEYNGLYFHTENMGKNQSYHLNKTLSCNQIGYKLIQIFEDEWMLKKDLVKNKIKHILGYNEGVKIGARKTKIKKIKSEDKKVFLENNHIQGNDKSNIFYGAYYNDVLIGVMTFNSQRNMTKSNENEYELSRFCINNKFIVSGLASKILKTFINEYNPSSIISFADRRWTINVENNLYSNLGFVLVSIVKPNYFYYNSKINRYKRFHKFSFGKSNLKRKYPYLDFTKSESELTKELGYSKIWDCGLFKYQLDLTKK